MHERRGQVEAALHAAGIALGHPVGGVLELDERQQLLRALLGLGRVEPEQTPVHDEQLAPRLAGVEACLLQRDPDPGADVVRVLGHVDTRDLRPAGCDRQQRRQHPHRGRFPRPVGAQEAEDLARFDHEVHAADSFDRFVAAVVVLYEPFGANRRPTGLISLHALGL